MKEKKLSYESRGGKSERLNGDRVNDEDDEEINMMKLE